MHDIKHPEEIASAVQSVTSSLNAELLESHGDRRYSTKKAFFSRRDGILLEGGNKDCHFKGVGKGPRFQNA